MKIRYKYTAYGYCLILRRRTTLSAVARESWKLAHICTDNLRMPSLRVQLNTSAGVNRRMELHRGVIDPYLVQALAGRTDDRQHDWQKACSSEEAKSRHDRERLKRESMVHDEDRVRPKLGRDTHKTSSLQTHANFDGGATNVLDLLSKRERNQTHARQRRVNNSARKFDRAQHLNAAAFTRIQRVGRRGLCFERQRSRPKSQHSPRQYFGY